MYVIILNIYFVVLSKLSFYSHFARETPLAWARQQNKNWRNILLISKCFNRWNAGLHLKEPGRPLSRKFNGILSLSLFRTCIRYNINIILFKQIYLYISTNKTVTQITREVCETKMFILDAFWIHIWHGIYRMSYKNWMYKIKCIEQKMMHGNQCTVQNK